MTDNLAIRTLNGKADELWSAGGQEAQALELRLAGEYLRERNGDLKAFIAAKMGFAVAPEGTSSLPEQAAPPACTVTEAEPDTAVETEGKRLGHFRRDNRLVRRGPSNRNLDGTYEHTVLHDRACRTIDKMESDFSDGNFTVAQLEGALDGIPFCDVSVVVGFIRENFQPPYTDLRAKFDALWEKLPSEPTGKLVFPREVAPPKPSNDVLEIPVGTFRFFRIANTLIRWGRGPKCGFYSERATEDVVFQIARVLQRRFARERFSVAKVAAALGDHGLGHQVTATVTWFRSLGLVRNGRLTRPDVDIENTVRNAWEHLPEPPPDLKRPRD